MKIVVYSLIILAAVSMGACQKGFLDLEPKEGFGEEAFFKKSSDLKSYVNRFYDNTILLRRLPNTRIAGLDNGSDNLVTTTPAGNINTRAHSGLAPATIGWGEHYDFIRSINILLANTYKVPRDQESRQYTGEAFFARAVAYFDLLNTYGGVPLITTPLEINSEELYRPRESREGIARQIIKDLDSAIFNLSWKPEAGQARINKESALLMKTRVGLFEGSWERYHGAKGTPYAVSGSDGTEFLDAAVKAGEELIAHQGANIYQGTLVDLYQEKNLVNVPGAFFYRDYSRAGGLTHDFHVYAEGLGMGITKQFVDQVLMRDGRPAEISAVVNDETDLRALGQNKDPRLSSTIWTRPVDENGNSITFYDAYDGDHAQNNLHAYKNSYPGFIQTQQRYPTPTGYRPWKGVILDDSEWRNGVTPDLIFRYAEALLNYAEAKAILGTLEQTDLDQSINLLRDLAGMPRMDMAAINGWSVVYRPSDGYDPNAANIVNEIRRERRVELAMEGFRRDDLRRWAQLDDVINGLKPLGAHAEEFVDYWNENNDELKKDGFIPIGDHRLTVGTHYGLDASGRYFNPFFRDGDFGNAGGGGFVDPGRDYLQGIGSQEIELYRTKGGVELEQNPGYF